jgi:peptidoglycan hydrolase-like protein with peptidoglycan-binding domain
MRRLWWVPVIALAACHAHTTAGNQQAQMEKPPNTPQVSSARPVRTTPGGMLDPEAMKKIQARLGDKGYKVDRSGQLDQATEGALRKFQAHEHVAATGLPDYDTLRRLGLDPRKIYLGGTERRDEHRGDDTAKRSQEAKQKDEAKR